MSTYPPDELAQGHEGTVILQITVAVDGSVRDVNVAQSVTPLLDAAAIAAVMQWTFVPARRDDGTALPSRISIPIQFEKPPTENPLTEQPPTASPPTAQPVTAQPPPDQSKTEVRPVDIRDPGSEISDPTSAEEDKGVLDVTVRGKQKPASRGASDYQFEIGALKAIPRANAAEILKLAPGILLTNEGGEGHAEQVFLRGFDARARPGHRVHRRRHPHQRVGQPARQRLLRPALHHPRAGAVIARHRGPLRSASRQLRCSGQRRVPLGPHPTWSHHQDHRRLVSNDARLVHLWLGRQERG